MKVLVNGGINLSELDGWWAEAYEPGVGWAIQKQHVDDEQSDAAEAEALYTKLEQEIIPLFYYRDNGGLPVGWIAHVRESMARLTPEYSADRAVRDYTEKYYLNAASTYKHRAQENGAAANRLLDWRNATAQAWPNIRYGELHIETNNGEHTFRLELDLGDLRPDSVRVELYADALPGGPIERQQMIRLDESGSSGSSHVYNVRLPANRPAGDYTARVIPDNPEAIIPLEVPLIVWQK